MSVVPAARAAGQVILQEGGPILGQAAQQLGSIIFGTPQPSTPVPPSIQPDPRSPMQERRPNETLNPISTTSGITQQEAESLRHVRGRGEIVEDPYNANPAFGEQGLSTLQNPGGFTWREAESLGRIRERDEVVIDPYDPDPAFHETGSGQLSTLDPSQRPGANRISTVQQPGANIVPVGRSSEVPEYRRANASRGSEETRLVPLERPRANSVTRLPQSEPPGFRQAIARHGPEMNRILGTAARGTNPSFFVNLGNSLGRLAVASGSRIGATRGFATAARAPPDLPAIDSLLTRATTAGPGFNTSASRYGTDIRIVFKGPYEQLKGITHTDPTLTPTFADGIIGQIEAIPLSAREIVTANKAATTFVKSYVTCREKTLVRLRALRTLLSTPGTSSTQVKEAMNKTVKSLENGLNRTLPTLSEFVTICATNKPHVVAGPPSGDRAVAHAQRKTLMKNYVVPRNSTNVNSNVRIFENTFTEDLRGTINEITRRLTRTQTAIDAGLYSRLASLFNTTNPIDFLTIKRSIENYFRANGAQTKLWTNYRNISEAFTNREGFPTRVAGMQDEHAVPADVNVAIVFSLCFSPNATPDGLFRVAHSLAWIINDYRINSGGLETREVNMFLASAIDGVWEGRLFRETLTNNYLFTGSTVPLSDVDVARLVQRLSQGLINIVNEMINESNLPRNAAFRNLYNDAIALLRAFYQAAIGRPMPIAGGKLYGGNSYIGVNIPDIVFLKAAIAALKELPDPVDTTQPTTKPPTSEEFIISIGGLVALSNIFASTILPEVKTSEVNKYSGIPELDDPIRTRFSDLTTQIASLSHNGRDINHIQIRLTNILEDIRARYILYNAMRQRLIDSERFYNQRISQSGNNSTRQYNQSISSIFRGLIECLDDFETLPHKKLKYIVHQEILEEDAAANAVDLAIEASNINATRVQREALQEQVLAVQDIGNIIQNEARQFTLRALDVVINRNPILQLAWGAYMVGSTAISSVSSLLHGGKRSNTRKSKHKSKHISKHKTHKNHVSQKTRRYKRYLHRSRKVHKNK